MAEEVLRERGTRRAEAGAGGIDLQLCRHSLGHVRARGWRAAAADRGEVGTTPGLHTGVDGVRTWSPALRWWLCARGFGASG